MPHATDRIEVPDLGIVELPTFVTRGFARAYGHMVTGAFFDVSGVSHRAEGVIVTVPEDEPIWSVLDWLTDEE